MHPNPETRRMMISRLVARCGPNNRPGLDRHVEQDRNNWADLSIKSWAQAVVKADTVLDDKPFLTLTPDDCQRVMNVFRTIYTRASLRLKAISFRKHLRYLHGVNDLVESDLLDKRAARAIEQTLKVKRDKNTDKAPEGQVISEADFQTLLQSIKSRNFKGWDLADRDRAMWLIDRHAGFRIGEYLPRPETE